MNIKLMGFGNRGIVADKWSGRLLWVCAIGSAIGFYMVAVERQTQNRAKMMAEALADAGSSIDAKVSTPTSLRVVLRLHYNGNCFLSKPKCPLAGIEDDLDITSGGRLGEVAEEIEAQGRRRGVPIRLEVSLIVTE
ncbi:hypothetical protein H5410_038872 [Solanum commersonii]|uniref:Uncharacterized protein n=1 Tax=Solanum commersonii TaxID=4109 RepID=A0A9J5YDH9_SOLCO|nr:hypothetical protein H5410_038872 [Solanum commersonii]